MARAWMLSAWLWLAIAASGCGEEPMSSDATAPKAGAKPDSSGMQTAYLGGGCFWCTEAVFARLPGVADVKPGYMGGRTPNPTYEDVSAGGTGHAEVVRVEFDPARISFGELLDMFWRAHDPTTLNRQGADVGTQYRSVIFYRGEDQRRVATVSRDALARSGKYDGPIVTEISPAGEFYAAEDYHQDYFERNRGNPYCRAVIAPKLRKLGMEK